MCGFAVQPGGGLASMVYGVWDARLDILRRMLHFLHGVGTGDGGAGGFILDLGARRGVLERFGVRWVRHEDLNVGDDVHFARAHLVRGALVESPGNRYYMA